MNEKDTNSAIKLSIVYLAVSGIICEGTGRRPISFWLWLVWTLLVIVYVLVHDYIESVKRNYHELVKAVYQSEMRAAEEYKKLRGEKNGNRNRRRDV